MGLGPGGGHRPTGPVQPQGPQVPGDPARTVVNLWRGLLTNTGDINEATQLQRWIYDVLDETKCGGRCESNRVRSSGRRVRGYVCILDSSED